MTPAEGPAALPSPSRTPPSVPAPHPPGLPVEAARLPSPAVHAGTSRAGKLRLAGSPQTATGTPNDVHPARSSALSRLPATRAHCASQRPLPRQWLPPRRPPTSAPAWSTGPSQATESDVVPAGSQSRRNPDPLDSLRHVQPEVQVCLDLAVRHARLQRGRRSQLRMTMTNPVAAAPDERQQLPRVHPDQPRAVVGNRQCPPPGGAVQRLQAGQQLPVERRDDAFGTASGTPAQDLLRPAAVARDPRRACLAAGRPLHRRRGDRTLREKLRACDVPDEGKWKQLHGVLRSYGLDRD